MPRVRERCCLTSCEFYCLFLQRPCGAQVWLSSNAGLAVTLSYLGCIFGANTPIKVTQHSLGEQKNKGRTPNRKRKFYTSALTFVFLVWWFFGVFVLALVSLCLAIGTGLVYEAESRVLPRPEFMALKMVLVPRLQQQVTLSHIFSESFFTHRN